MMTDPDAGHGQLELWSFREEVQVEFARGDSVARLLSRWGDMTIERPSPAVREALRRMQLGPISLENVVPGGPAEVDLETGSLQQWARLYAVLDRLQPLIIRTLAFQTGEPLLSVVPLTPQSRFRPMPLQDDVEVRLSRFAELRTDGREIRLDSPLSLHRVVLHRPEASCLIGALGRPATLSEVRQAWPSLDGIAPDALAYLAAAGLIVQVSNAPGENAELAGWSPVDLMFHTRSTAGRHDQPVGNIPPEEMVGKPEPAVLPHREGSSIPLHRPRWEDLLVTDPPLAVAMEARRSTRKYGAEPVTADELGDLLYRTARLRALIAAPSSAAAGEFTDVLSDRPYPGAGACYELELYITVGRCNGIPPGTYHYDPGAHRLEPVNADRGMALRLLADAGKAAALEDPPPLLFTMTARYRRISRSYQGIAYALVLKNVGVLYQSLYLVCTAMRLAPCAIGSVNTQSTAYAFGTDWQHEPSVGQFIVGRAPDAYPQYTWQWHPVNDADWINHAMTHLTELSSHHR